MLVAAAWYFEYILARISDITLADAQGNVQQARTNKSGFVRLWPLQSLTDTCVCVFRKAGNTSNMFMEHSSRAYLYIDTWSWSSSVARSVILIPFKLTARETRCSFLPLAFAYRRKKKEYVIESFFFSFFWLKWRKIVIIIVWNIRLKKFRKCLKFLAEDEITINIWTRHLEF